MVPIWNKTLNYCDTILKMTPKNNGIICFYRNDSIDDKWEGEDGKGYYFVDDQRGVLVVGTEF